MQNALLQQGPPGKELAHTPAHSVHDNRCHHAKGFIIQPINVGRTRVPCPNYGACTLSQVATSPAPSCMVVLILVTSTITGCRV